MESSSYSICTVPRTFTSKTPTNKRKVLNSVSKTREWKERRGWKARGTGMRGGLGSEGVEREGD